MLTTKIYFFRISSEQNKKKNVILHSAYVGISFEAIRRDERKIRIYEDSRHCAPRFWSFVLRSSPVPPLTYWLLWRSRRGAREQARGNAHIRYLTAGPMPQQKWQGSGNYNGWRKKMAPQYGWADRPSWLPFLFPFRRQPLSVCIREPQWLIARVSWWISTAVDTQICSARRCKQQYILC